jgi:hypothetical protein
MTMIPGVQITMGGEEWTVAPLTLGQLRRLMPQVQQLTEIGARMGESQIAAVVEIVTAALQRNYPDLTTDAVAEILDLGNSAQVLHVVLTGSGLRERRPGEAMAVARCDGQTSTPSSPPPADIHIP